MYEAVAAIMVITTLPPIEGTKHFSQIKKSDNEMYVPHMKLISLLASFYVVFCQ